MADRAGWKGKAGFAAFAFASIVLLALNFRGRTPLDDFAFSLLKPAFALAGAAGKPIIGAPTDIDPEIRLLRARNARLSHELAGLRETLEAVSTSRFDGKRYPFRAVPARVLAGMGDSNPRRMVIVDRGAADGVAPGMGVVAGDTAVGLVHRCNEELSIVLLITDPAFRIRCTLLDEDAGPGNAAGIECIGEGLAQREDLIALRHVPYHEDVALGRDVVTSGRGGAFPAGMFVGTVETAGRGFDLFQDVLVKPAIAGERIGSVLILVPCVPGADGRGKGAADR